MAKNKVEITRLNTNDIVVLKNNEMNSLFKLFKEKKDYNVRNKLIEGNYKLVLSILKKYQNRTDNMDDLFQIGCIGLIKAIDNFDLSHNVRFSTYAVPLILGEIRRYIRDNNNVRISRSIKDLGYKIIKYKEEYFKNKGKEITNIELAKILEVEEIDIIIALEALREPMSLQEAIYNDGGDTIYLEDQIESKKNHYTLWDNNISIKYAIEELNEKEKNIIKQRYIDGKTQIELAEELNISQAQVSRLEKSGLQQIKNKIK